MLEGSFRDFKIDEVLQIISLGKKTGKLELKGTSVFGDERGGNIYFEEGRIIHFTSPATHDSIANIFSLRTGNFKFFQGELPMKRTIDISVSDLILNIISKIDEWNVIKEKVISLDSVFILSSEGIPSEIQLTPEKWRLIALLNEERSLREIAKMINMAEMEIAKVAYGLITLGIIKEQKQILPRIEERKEKRNFIMKILERIRRL